MRNIICIAQSRWSSDTPERPQRWMQGLSSAEISYFELTVTSKLSVFLTRRGVLEVTEPQPGVKVYRLPAYVFSSNRCNSDGKIQPETDCRADLSMPEKHAYRQQCSALVRHADRVGADRGDSP